MGAGGRGRIQEWAPDGFPFDQMVAGGETNEGKKMSLILYLIQGDN